VNAQRAAKWIGGITPECYRQSPALEAVQSQLIALLEGRFDWLLPRIALITAGQLALALQAGHSYTFFANAQAIL